MRLWFDCETRSDCDLKKHGTPRYAAHPSTRIIVAQWALDDGPPIVVGEPEGLDPTTNTGLRDLLAHLANPEVEVWAHNSMFDRSLLRACWDIDVPILRWRDTMVQAMSHALPGGLDKLSTIFGLAPDAAKDKRGKALIRKICIPPFKATPDEWNEFLEYADQDIIAMREIAKKLPAWNYPNNIAELALWHLDQTINDRGFAVDMDLVKAAITTVEVETERLKTAMGDATSGFVTSVNKRDDLLQHILAAYGVTLPDMSADTLRRRLEDPTLPDGVKLILSIRLEGAKSSTAKYKALLNAVTDDGRMHNTLQFAGALRTQRWAGRTFQPQNLPRPTAKADAIEADIDAIKAMCAPLLVPDVMQATSNALRGCIIAPPGRKLVVADLSNIEGRGLAWLADETWKIKAFSAFDHGHGHDLYKLAYARSFGVKPESVDKEQRQVGKVQELGLGYEGGVAAFLTFAAVYRMDLGKMADAVLASVSSEQIQDAKGVLDWAKKQDRALGLDDRVYMACEILKKAWRDAHPAIVALWRGMRDAFASAVATPGVTFHVGDQLAVRRMGSWLRVRLPSGRSLSYLKPKCSESGQLSYLGVNSYTRKWEQLNTYGGKLVENVTQAWARDILASSMPTIERDGYAIVLTVHDEVITETPDEDRFNVGALSRLMSTPPEWAAGCPLAAAGFEGYRYRKD